MAYNATGLLTKGIELGYKASSATAYTKVDNLQEVPDLGGAPEKVDTTTLENSNYTYIPGIKDMGDLAFGFLYDNEGSTSNYRVLKGLEGEEQQWEVKFPDGTKFHFNGIPTVTTDGAGVNAAIKFTLHIMITNDIVVVDP